MPTGYIRDPLAPPPDHIEYCRFKDGTGKQKSRMELKHTVDPFRVQAVPAVYILSMFLLCPPDTGEGYRRSTLPTRPLSSPFPDSVIVCSVLTALKLTQHAFWCIQLHSRCP